MKYTITPITAHGITRYEVRCNGQRIGSAGDIQGANDIINDHQRRST